MRVSWVVQDSAGVPPQADWMTPKETPSFL